ncbi:hypothetical protein BSPCLSOX_2085, partial [uncultured Gammaproteobacteria bacterium]
MLNKDTLNTLFTKARSHNGWLDKSISETQIKEIYALMKFGPTAANTCPVRITFVQSSQAKARLKPHLDEGNVAKAMA